MEQHYKTTNCLNYVAMFTIGKHCLAFHTILGFMRYTQGLTLIRCDNLCAIGLANDDIKMKRIKYVDIKYHWIRSRVRSGDFTVSWIGSNLNRADYFTKNLPPATQAAIMDTITTAN